jgi:hypothetical protein
MLLKTKGVKKKRKNIVQKCAPNRSGRFAFWAALRPEQGLAIGCKLLRKKLDALDGDTARGLLAWNGGGNPAYPAKVLARPTHYL